MAQFLKAHSDLKGVLNYDVAEYENDAVTVIGFVASATTVTVTSISGTATAGMAVQGPGIAVGTTFVSYVAPTLTVSAGGITAAVGSQITLVCKTVVATDVTIQPQGPKLQVFTVTGASAPAYAEAIMQVVQQRATVHVYEVKSSTTEIAFLTYGTEAWSFGSGAANDLDAALYDAIDGGVGPATFTSATGATFTG